MNLFLRINTFRQAPVLEPAVAITAQQDRRPRGMIENIILYDRLPRRAEQGTAGTVIPDHVIRE